MDKATSRGAAARSEQLLAELGDVTTYTNGGDQAILADPLPARSDPRGEGILGRDGEGTRS